MNEGQKAETYCALVSAMAANRAHIRLCRMLAAKGIFDRAEMEAMRQLHLLDFDATIDEMPHAAAREALHDARVVLDADWQKSVGDGPLPA